MNEKLRKEVQENAEEGIEKSREKAREKAEKLLADKLEKRELQSEIPVQRGEADTSRIKHRNESDDTNAGGALMFLLFF